MNYLIIILIATLSIGATPKQSPTETINSPEDLLGTWKLDMTPHNPNDANYAMMRITEVEGSSFRGHFYREGVKIQNGRLNTQSGKVHGALISQDNSGKYHTSYYLKDGKLYGTTHAIDRNFLAVWTATKTK